MNESAKREQALKAADTRRENVERARQEGVRLAQETAGGRPAKRKALQNQIWIKPNAKPVGSTAKQAGGRRKAIEREQDHGSGNQARNNFEDEAPEAQDEQLPKPKKLAPKGGTKKPRAPEIENSAETNDEDETREYLNEQPLKIKRTPALQGIAKKHQAPDFEGAAGINGEDEALEYLDEQPPKIRQKLAPQGAAKKRQAPDFQNSAEFNDKNDDEHMYLDGFRDPEDDKKDGEDEDEEGGTEEDEEGETEEDEKIEKEDDAWDGVDLEVECPVIVNEDEDEGNPASISYSNYRTIRPPLSQLQTETTHFDPNTLNDEGDNEPGITSAVNVNAATTRKRHRQVLESSDDDEENMPPAPPLPKKKARLRVSGSRQEAFRAERPQLKENRTHQSAALSSAKVMHNSWSDDVQLVPLILPTTKKRQLKQQSPLIQNIIRHSIDLATEEIILKDNWPEEGKQIAYGKELALKACDNVEICTAYDAVMELKKRLQMDKNFTKGLCEIIVDRLSTVRAAAKDEASNHLSGYQLGIGESCMKRVESLLKGYQFHMIGHWGGEDNNTWIPDTKSSFQNPVLISTIKKAFFSNARSTGYRFIEQFTSSVEGQAQEKEIPMPLLVLALTAIYCCLSEYQNGEKKRLDFDGKTFLSINRSLMNVLNRTKNSRPLDFHRRMHELYEQVVKSNMIVFNTEEIEESAFNIIDF
ncbi:hypothetical protein CPB83DRAFT_894241 [Crepidotus variabilis]|uniref:DUF6532 domain-containing protein n=1 Tax=Crepidotus variabilis TaxID=179855 RepID=A0A9P6JQ33_9AGAR|nr:hypothetical protein CPB83DRAFT_894241 [Crepidotus variabilis]